MTKYKLDDIVYIDFPKAHKKMFYIVVDVFGICENGVVKNYISVRHLGNNATFTFHANDKRLKKIEF